jgi:SGT1 protein
MEAMDTPLPFKGFGEGFEGFPKNLPDSTIEYALYVIDEKLDSSQKLSYLRTALQNINEAAKYLFQGYIWQRDPFKIEVEFKDGFWGLYGSVNFGDSIADEWAIVLLLTQASEKNPELWLRMVDTDGEFLLIEGAYALPKWVTPEISKNRVSIPRHVWI